MTRPRRLSDLTPLSRRRTYPNEGRVVIGQTSISIPKMVWSQAGSPRRVQLLADEKRGQILIMSTVIDPTMPVRTVDRTSAAAYRRVYVKTNPVERRHLREGAYRARVTTIENQKAIVLQDALKEGA